MHRPFERAADGLIRSGPFDEFETPAARARADRRDEIIQRGRCAREGYAGIGFGEAAGRITAARPA
jgi:hypothetical protein